MHLASTLPHSRQLRRRAVILQSAFLPRDPDPNPSGARGTRTIASYLILFASLDAGRSLTQMFNY